MQLFKKSDCFKITFKSEYWNKNSLWVSFKNKLYILGSVAFKNAN